MSQRAAQAIDRPETWIWRVPKRRFRGSFGRRRLVFVALISSLVNALYLTGSFFMLQVYDRVIPSRSVPTLVALSILASLLFVFQAVLDFIRSRTFVRLGMAFEEESRAFTFERVVRLPLMGARDGDGLQPLRDVAAIRSFFSGGGPLVFLDLPWLPFFLAICFAFHPLIGIVATGGAGLLLLVALASELLTRGPVKAGTALTAARQRLAEDGVRNAESLAAMGMTEPMRERWSAAADADLAAQARSSDVAGGLGAISKALRLLLQSATLGIGAYLVIKEQATSGVIIASSILVARALAPVEQVVGQWKGLLAARQAWSRLRRLATALPDETARLALPAPVARLSVSGLAVQPPGAGRAIVSGISFEVEAGSAVGVIGASASGKTTLARAIVNVWPGSAGSVRLDGAPHEQWSREALGRHIGYLPQDVELFSGTIAENIGRLREPVDSEAVVRAARAAGVHEMILALDGGYNAQVGRQGNLLSKGQRQRIALARALFGEPFVVVLDEPNANLDQDGEEALTRAVLSIRARGGIAIVVAHRPNAIAAVDLVLMMAKGRAHAFGPRDEVLERVLSRPSTPLKVVASE